MSFRTSTSRQDEDGDPNSQGGHVFQSAFTPLMLFGLQGHLRDRKRRRKKFPAPRRSVLMSPLLPVASPGVRGKASTDNPKDPGST